MKLISHYKNEILLVIKLAVPLIGVFVFGWSIGDLFLYYCIDLVLTGAETILKIWLAWQSGFWPKLGSTLRFTLCFPIFILLIMIAMGQNFDGSRQEMEAYITLEIFYTIVAITAIDFLISYIFSGEFKKNTAASAEKSTYKHLIVAAIILALTGFILNRFVSTEHVNYVLGVSIILAKQLSDYFLKQLGVRG
ncbi:MAG: hypothetical protein IPH66_01405 [Crocinitomicaceae bacterium]|nr:hypothetical protein [Crocinitomicaceae bacterium]